MIRTRRPIAALVLLSVAACSSAPSAEPAPSTTASAPATTEPETTETATTEPEASRPETTEPEVTEPETTEPSTTERVTAEVATTQPATTETATTEPEPPVALARLSSLPGPVAAGTHTLWWLEPPIDITIGDGWSAGWTLGDDTAVPTNVASLQHRLSTGFVRLTFWTNDELTIDGEQRADLRAYARELPEAGDRTEQEIALADGPATRFDFTWTGEAKALIPLQSMGIPVGAGDYTVARDQPQHWVVRDTPYVQLLATWTVEGGHGPDLEAEAAALVEPILASLRFTDVVPPGTLSGTALPAERRIEPSQVLSVAPVELKVALAAGDRLVMRDDVGTVYSVDPATGQVTGPQPYPDTLGVIAGHDAVWLAQFSTGLVKRIDPRTLAESAAIDVGVDPSRVAVTDDAVWSADHRGGTVTRIDPATNTADRSIRLSGPGRRGPQEMLVDGDALWVAVPGFDQLARLDASTGEVVASIELRAPCGRMIQVDQRLFVGSCDTDLVHVIDTETNTLERTIGVGAFQIEGGLAVDGQVWFSTVDEADTARLVAIDATTLELTDAIALDVAVTGASVAFDSVWLSRIDGTLTRHSLDAFAAPTK